MKKIYVILFMAISLCSCEEFMEFFKENPPPELTSEEVVEGLKTALEIATDTAVTVLSIANGYYGNPLMKIPLPENAQFLRDKLTNNELAGLFKLDEKFEDVIKSVNRAAEEAAKEAGPIFKNAITSMSIIDAMDILKGINPVGDTTSADFDSTAATEYFRVKTLDSLISLYAPKINLVLDKDLGLGFSANRAWDVLTSSYNDGLDLINSNFLTSGLDEKYELPAKINDNLGEFSTKKALDGLFIRVGKEEKKIRKDPFQWAVDIIQKVFGHVFEDLE